MNHLRQMATIALFALSLTASTVAVAENAEVAVPMAVEKPLRVNPTDLVDPPPALNQATVMAMPPGSQANWAAVAAGAAVVAAATEVAHHYKERWMPEAIAKTGDWAEATKAIGETLFDRNTLGEVPVNSRF